MRPDRIIVGEVRGPEAFDMMQAMNTGHNGSMSTIHANSARDALARIENMMLMANVNLPMRAIRGQIVSAIDLVVQTERMRDGVRRVTEVAYVAGLEGEIISFGNLFLFKYLGENADGTLRGTFEPRPRGRAFCRGSNISAWPMRSWIRSVRMGTARPDLMLQLQIAVILFLLASGGL